MACEVRKTAPRCRPYFFGFSSFSKPAEPPRLPYQRQFRHAGRDQLGREAPLLDLVVVPVLQPVDRPPIAQSLRADGQSTWKLFGPVLLEGPVDEICCTPLVPGGPCGPAAPAGPCGPFGICPIPKSAARSERFCTLAELTAFAFS